MRGAPDPGSGELVPISDGNQEPLQPDPRPMTGSEIYRAWFGIDRLTPNPHGDALRRYLVLAGDPLRTDAEQHELVRLQSELTQAKIEEVAAPEPREDKA